MVDVFSITVVTTELDPEGPRVYVKVVLSTEVVVIWKISLVVTETLLAVELCADRLGIVSKLAEPVDSNDGIEVMVSLPYFLAMAGLAFAKAVIAVV